MARNTVASVLYKIFADNNIRKVLTGLMDTYNPSLQNILFPQDTTNQTSFDELYTNSLDMAAPYIARGQNPQTANYQTFTGGLHFPFPVKGTVIKTELRDWFDFGEKSLTGDEIERLTNSAQKFIYKANKFVEITNELEFSKFLTLGMYSGDVDVSWSNNTGMHNLPFYNFTRDGSGSSMIGYTSRTNWFAVGGTVNTSADIIKDLESAMLYMIQNEYGYPVNIIMNTNTYQAIYQNTRLRGDYVAANFAPVDISEFTNGLFTGNVKFLRQWKSPITSFGANLMIYDGYVNLQSASSRTSTSIKLIPDYYVIITPDRIGARLVAPNPDDHVPHRFVKANEVKAEWSSYSDYNINVTECSYCVPYNRYANNDNSWRSHYVLYVKAAS